MSIEQRLINLRAHQINPTKQQLSMEKCLLFAEKSKPKNLTVVNYPI